MERGRLSDDYDSYLAPTPVRFYIHDDISDEIRDVHGVDSKAYRLTESLFDLLRRDAERVVILRVDEQIDLLVSTGDHVPFDMAIGIGKAGERVINQVHRKTGWFPNFRRVDVTRIEDGRGGYTLGSTTSESLDAQVGGLDRFQSLAVVDDTVFSGITMRTVLSVLSPDVLERTQAFCLRCVEETLASIEALCPISAGFRARGRILEDVSFINASGLVRPIGIRREGRPAMAFIERTQWMEAWFPGYAGEVVELCRRIDTELHS